MQNQYARTLGVLDWMVDVVGQKKQHWCMTTLHKLPTLRHSALVDFRENKNSGAVRVVLNDQYLHVQFFLSFFTNNREE